jgi:hypothetical protein
MTMDHVRARQIVSSPGFTGRGGTQPRLIQPKETLNQTSSAVGSRQLQPIRSKTADHPQPERLAGEQQRSAVVHYFGCWLQHFPEAPGILCMQQLTGVGSYLEYAVGDQAFDVWTGREVPGSLN